MDIVIPSLGDIEEVEVIELCVAVGDVVQVDEGIIVVESDKASMELPSPAAGTIKAINVAVGEQIGEGHVVAVLETAEAEATAEAPGEPEPETVQSAQVETGAEEPVSDPPAPEPKTHGGGEIDVLVPDIGDAKDVVVVEIAIQEGDEVAAGDLLVVLESDKASMEIVAEQPGVVVKLGVREGDEVDQGTHIATLSVRGAEEPVGSELSAAASPGPEAASIEQPTAADESSTAAPAVADLAADGTSNGVPTTGAKVYAGPAVRRLARELGVELEAVEGSGNRGRITKDDVKGFVKTRLTGESAEGGSLPRVPAIDFAKFGEVDTVPLSRIRVRGAQNLHASWVNLPHVTQHDEADVTELEQFRKSLKAEAETKGVKLTPLSFVVKACCHALKEQPEFNASLHGDGKQLVLKKYVNIGLAVDTPEGLVVPVIKAADEKGIWELSAEIADLSERARNKKLAIDDMQGGSFSISSLGAIGGTGFTPIVNAPEVAILGVARLATKPVWNGAEFEPRQMLPLSLSYDHRVINGADGGRFMVSLTSLLSDIRRLSL